MVDLVVAEYEKALNDGDLKHAKYLLNRPYTFRGLLKEVKV